MGIELTREQKKTLKSLGYFKRSAVHPDEVWEDRIFGFCFVDQRTGDRYLTNGAGWGGGAILVLPTGTTDCSIILPSSTSIKLEGIQQYLVLGVGLGIRITFVPGSNLEIRVFPNLDALTNGIPHPFRMCVELLVEVSHVLEGGEEGCPQGWKVKEFQFNVLGGNKVSSEEANRLLIGYKSAIAISKDFENFIKSPRFWVNHNLFRPEILS